jgi:hypothetical protein
MKNKTTNNKNFKIITTLTIDSNDDNYNNNNNLQMSSCRKIWREQRRN